MSEWSILDHLGNPLVGARGFFFLLSMQAGAMLAHRYPRLLLAQSITRNTRLSTLFCYEKGQKDLIRLRVGGCCAIEVDAKIR